MVSYAVQDRLAIITLNAPRQHNALGAVLLRALGDAFVRASQAEAVKVVLLRAEGVSFCAGADLSDLRSLQDSPLADNQASAELLAQTFDCVYRCPKLVVAEVQGAALAGGCGLVSLCDVVFAHTAVRFACTEVRIGFVPAIIMRYLQQRIGSSAAKWLLLSGESILAQRALDLGLVQYISATPEALGADVQAFCQKIIARNSATAMQATKGLFQQVEGLSIASALSLATEQNALLRDTAACKRGVQRFLDKEPLDWQDA